MRKMVESTSSSASSASSSDIQLLDTLVSSYVAGLSSSSSSSFLQPFLFDELSLLFQTISTDLVEALVTYQTSQRQAESSLYSLPKDEDEAEERKRKAKLDRRLLSLRRPFHETVSTLHKQRGHTQPVQDSEDVLLTLITRPADLAMVFRSDSCSPFVVSPCASPHVARV